MIKELLIDSASKLINVARIPLLYVLLNYLEYDSNAVKYFSVSFSVLMLASSVISFGLFDQLNREAVLSPLVNRRSIFFGSTGALIISIVLSIVSVCIYLTGYTKIEAPYLFLLISVLIFIKNSISIYFRSKALFSKVMLMSLADLTCVLAAGFVAVYFDNINILLFGNGLSAVFILVYIFVNNLHRNKFILEYLRICKFKLMIKDFSFKFKFALPSLLYVSMYWGVSLALKNKNYNSVGVNYFYLIDICYSAIFPAIAFLISFVNIKAVIGFDLRLKMHIFHAVLGVVLLFALVFVSFGLESFIPILAILLVIFAVELFGISVFSIIYIFYVLMSSVYIREELSQFYCFALSVLAAFVLSKHDMFLASFYFRNSKSVDQV